MTPERLEIARQMVACPKWVWLPGMAVCFVDMVRTSFRLVIVADRSDYGYAAESSAGLCEVSLPVCIPDLDDDLTRLGVLAVVRRAWGASDIFGLSYHIEGGWAVEIDDRVFSGPTEEAALLAALEAAK